jgi:hypothetical protein
MPPETRGQKRKRREQLSSMSRFFDDMERPSACIPGIPTTCIGKRLFVALTHQIGLCRDLAQVVLECIPKQTFAAHRAVVECSPEQTRAAHTTKGDSLAILYKSECKYGHFCDCKPVAVETRERWGSSTQSSFSLVVDKFRHGFWPDYTWPEFSPHTYFEVITPGARKIMYCYPCSWYIEGKERGVLVRPGATYALYKMYRNVQERLGQWDL